MENKQNAAEGRLDRGDDCDIAIKTRKPDILTFELVPGLLNCCLNLIHVPQLKFFCNLSVCSSSHYRIHYYLDVNNTFTKVIKPGLRQGQVIHWL